MPRAFADTAIYVIPAALKKNDPPINVSVYRHTDGEHYAHIIETNYRIITTYDLYECVLAVRAHRNNILLTDALLRYLAGGSTPINRNNFQFAELAALAYEAGYRQMKWQCDSCCKDITDHQPFT